MTINIRLKKLRLESDLTAKEFGKLFNLAESTISNYENGKRTPDYNTLMQIADYFNVSVDYLLGRTETRNLTIKEHNEAKFSITKGHENDYTEEDLEMALKIIDMMKKGKT